MGLVALLFLALILFMLYGRPNNQNQNDDMISGEQSDFVDDTQSEMIEELEIEDIQEGDGEEAASLDTITVHYKGELEDGTLFDSSYERGEPFTFVLGEGSVIDGWEEGIVGMKEGGTRRLTIPPSLAYGEVGAGSLIPPNATLVFVVELLEVNKSETGQPQ